jgi:ribosomal-protein-alanine N-acetyltransferase
MEDVEAFSRLAADAEVTRFLYWGPFNAAQSKKFIQRAVDLAAVPVRRKYIEVIENLSGELMGYLFLNVKSFINSEAEITYCLKKEFWGQGFGSEALKLFLEFAYHKLQLNRIFARVDEENLRSIRMLEKNGFVYEGKLRQDAFIKGKFRDSLIYSQLANEFVPDSKKSV